MLESRNPYHGEPPRPWIAIRLVASNGRAIRIVAVVDTGSPFHLVTSARTLRRCRVRDALPAVTNFGMMDAGWAVVRVPELQFAKELLIHGSDEVVKAIARSSRQFGGLIGLPFLRMFEYGGNAQSFWLRPAETKGTP